MNVELSSEEQTLLQQVLEAERNRLLVEIRHADHRDYKAALLRREEVLETLLSRISGAPTTAS
jgi:hypothetical protein